MKLKRCKACDWEALSEIRIKFRRTHVREWRRMVMFGYQCMHCGYLNDEKPMFIQQAFVKRRNQEED